MEINHGKYKIVQFKAGKDKFYQARAKINNKWWYSENFYKTILEAGDEAREIIYN